MALIVQDHNSSSSSHSNNSSANSTPPSSFTSPVNRSRSFSISDILSDEVGSRKRSASISSENGVAPSEKHRKAESATSPSDLLPIRQAAGVMMSPVNLPLSLPTIPINTVYPPLAYTPQHPLSFLTPHSLTPPQTLSLPISCSPFNAQLAALALPGSVASSPKQVTPFRNPSLFDHHPSLSSSHGQPPITSSNHGGAGVLNGSGSSESNPLGLLSSVACGRPYQSDPVSVRMTSSGGRGSTSQDGDVPPGDRFQDRTVDARLLSCNSANPSSRADSSDKLETTDENSMVGRHATSDPTVPPVALGSATPCILKRGRRRNREGQEYDSLSVDGTFSSPSSMSSSYQFSSSQSFSHFPFKHAAGSATLPSLSFSPSIFLTRPSNGSCGQSPLNSSPGTDADGQPIVRKQQFMTSTPIRRGGEGMAFWSPTTNMAVNSPIMASGRRHQDSAECSSGANSGDAEQPLLRRPSGPRRRLRAHGSLSPLLEKSPNIPYQSNPTSLPPLRPHPPHVPPSSLLTSYTAYKPSYSQSFGVDSGIVADAHSQLVPPSVMPSSPYQPHPMLLSYFSSPHPKQKVPVSYHALWGTSPVTEHLNRTGQIQSVPPWFICFDKKSDGKRLRLTEAINKSLQDSPKHKRSESLPPEWRKYAYGQTEDQKDLTLKARNFLRCRPRVLKFDQSKPKPCSSA